MPEPRVAKEVYIQSMRAELEGLLGEVMEAVNEAPGGRVIEDSEEWGLRWLQSLRNFFGKARENEYSQSEYQFL